MPTPLIPQEIYLLERYTSLGYFGEMRDAWEMMVKAGDDALDAFMHQLPADYRSLPLHQQPDIVWGERVLPNLRWTLAGLNNGFIQLSHGEWDALQLSGNVKTAQAGMWRDYDIDWMPEPFKTIFDEQERIAGIYASNISFSVLSGWLVGSLSQRYKELTRGPLDAPTTWPIYKINPNVRVRTGDLVPRNGIYLPDVDDSCPQALVQGYEATEANIGRDPVTTQRQGEAPATWTLVERIADEGGGVPGQEMGSASAMAGLRCEGGQPCPQAGWWLTPAKVGSRRFFNAGELMPVIQGSDYGATFWQWDVDQSASKI
ncbi:hypothetical protein [Pseudorhodoferax sp.]|uniref:hypothetical protein n=1 Tax=Pseudorhodoferax sp. TaxID=1993553 RepID=UPI0039E6A54E